MMKNNFVMILMLWCSTFVAAQSDIHQVEVIGSISFGEQELTVFYDRNSDCERKSTPHTVGLFELHELVQLSFNAERSTGRVVKDGLDELVYVNYDCESTNFLRKGQEKVKVVCGGTCSCSLEGVLGGEDSYVQCSCDDCAMELTFSGANRTVNEVVLEDDAKMQVPLLEEFITYADENFETYELMSVEVYTDVDGVAVAFVFNSNGNEESVMYSRKDGRTFRVTCEGECGCKEIYSYTTNSSSCSCDDCTMTVEEVFNN